jgi:hypothetical protein
MQRIVSVVILLCMTVAAYSQVTIFGTVTDGLSGKPVELVNVYVEGSNNVVETKRDGTYELSVEPGVPIVLVFNRIGYKDIRTELEGMPNGARREINVELASIDSGVEVIVTDSRIEDAGMIREDMDDLKLLPTTTGNLESVLPNIALGASSGTGGELSSQYNVRGGNYDENLVYVNDFEIYRPQLIRAGQQEGLTFPNIDLIQSLSFSSGGFAAKYGDKLSSVLDVKYKRPEETKASIGLSFLGGSAHVEGSIPVGDESYKKFRYLIGARYKTTRYLLGSLDIEGEYTPNFADIQGYFTLDLNRDWQLAVLANYNRSVYRFVPQTRSTALGLINFALELFTVFEGQENDDFTTQLGGVSLTYIPDRNRNPFYMKFLASTYQSQENERIDIIGFYNLRQIETGLGSDNFGEVVAELGTGTQHQFVRNYLTANVTNVQHKGGIELQIDSGKEEVNQSHFVQWGVRYQNELIDDSINEWERLDSAGYSLDYDTNQVLVNRVLKTNNRLQSNRVTAFLQNTYTWQADSIAEFMFTLGVRAAYWDLNNDFIVTPRAQLLYKPLKKGKDISFRLAGGLYYQPPFYRELRNFEGEVNTGVLSQKSAHIVGGFTWDFSFKKSSDRKFRFITEMYYKRLWDMVSYDIENVRIRYSGENDAGLCSRRGFAFEWRVCSGSRIVV